MRAVVFGGGKIARGFIGQLLYRSGFDITFVEVNEELVRQLNEAGAYYVNVMGNPAASEWIDRYQCISLKDVDGIADALKKTDIAFTSVGGKNLDSLASVIAAAFTRAEPELKEKVFTIITCENWKGPAEQLRGGILQELGEANLQTAFEAHVGVSEAAIIRSGVEATEEVQKIDRNAVSVTDYWELPIDKKRMKGPLISFVGADYKENFGSFLQQKIYTFNTTNATIAYLGRLRKIELLSEAANDPEITEIVRGVQEEINLAISREMNIPLEEQELFSQKALKKYQDKNVIDFTERHGRDPIRKLGPTDRIIGTLRLAEKHGISYEALAVTAAAAIYYPATNPEDPSARELKKLREERGAEAVLQEVCDISPQEQAGKLILRQIEFLKQKGWLNV